jgi:hypothetical protein
VREQLAAAISERTGLDEAMALQAADVALNFIKEKLPPALAPVVDGQAPDLSDPGALLGQLGTLGSQLGGLGGQLGGLGNLFGRRPE